MNILLITGGVSSERKISLISGRSVKKGLEEAGHKIRLYDLRKGYAPLKKLAKKFDIIFPIIHGEEGEGGRLNQFLKTLKKPFVGGDPVGLKKGWYKIPFKAWCDKNKIATSDWREVRNIQDLQEFGFPSVLKSSSGGSSREVVILNSFTDLKKKETKKLLHSKDRLFVEKYLKGIEMTVAVLGNKSLPVIEIVPPQDSWFNYKNKYSGQTQKIPFAPSVDKKLQKQAQGIALRIHQEFRLGQFSRTDFIVYNNEPHVLEVNTIPGFTPNSLFPKAAKAAGLNFPQLLDKIIVLALHF